MLFLRCCWHQWTEILFHNHSALPVRHPCIPKLPTPLGTLQTMNYPPTSTHGVSESIALRGVQSDLLTPHQGLTFEVCLLHGIPDPWEMRLERLNAVHSNFPLLGRDIGEGEKKGKEKICLRLLCMLYKAFLVVFQNSLPVLSNITPPSCFPCCANPKLLGNLIPPGMIFPRFSPDKLLFILKDPAQITLLLWSLSCPCVSPLSRLCRLSYLFDPIFTTVRVVCPNFCSHSH